MYILITLHKTAQNHYNPLGHPEIRTTGVKEWDFITSTNY